MNVAALLMDEINWKIKKDTVIYLRDLFLMSIVPKNDHRRSHSNVYFKNSVSSWWLIVRQSNPEWFDYKPWREGCETDYYYAGRGGRWL